MKPSRRHLETVLTPESFLYGHDCLIIIILTYFWDWEHYCRGQGSKRNVHHAVEVGLLCKWLHAQKCKLADELLDVGGDRRPRAAPPEQQCKASKWVKCARTIMSA